MSQIFTTLAAADTLALLATAAFGIATGLRGATGPAYLSHFVLGLFTAIGTLLVHCLIFTYFLGTGRWVKEVAAAYRLPDDPLPRLTRELKRKTFPPALAAMMVTIAAAAAGAGAQTHAEQWPWPVHATLAAATLAVNLWAFRLEYRNLRTNARVIDDVLAEVDRIRAERGLPSNAEALQQPDA